MVDGKDLGGLKGVRQRSCHHQPIFQDVGDTAGRTNIILKNTEFTGFRVPHQIDAADVGINSARDLDSNYLAPEMRAGINERPRNLAVFENALLAINILEKQIERHDSLGQTAVDAFPFRMGQDARNQVKRKQPLSTLTVAVNGKGNALNQKGKIGEFSALFELRRGHCAKLMEELGIVRARLSRRDEHLIIKAPRVVAFQQTM